MHQHSPEPIHTAESESHIQQADEEDRVFASFTDEENEAVEINDDQ